MPDQRFSVQDANGDQVTVYVRKDKRLKKTSRWAPQPDGSILLRVPYGLPKRQLRKTLDQVAGKLHKRQELAERRTDDALQSRAKQINRKCFNGDIQWAAIRWVSNMNTCLGSCTNGGPTDGHIRISAKIKGWPHWVVDYVIAHELAHRKYANHSKDFWAYLTAAYPQTERARGFIKGVGFAEGVDFEGEG